MSAMSSPPSQTATPTPEEQDQLRQSVKKHKRDEAEPVTLIDDSTGLPSPGGTPRTFTAILTKQRRPLYTGEGEEDIIDDFGLTDILQEQDVVAEGELCPIVDIPWESYKKSWQPWRRALIIRVLGKTFNFRMLEPRIRRLWHLEYDCDLIDLDKGYLVARFYSREDYLRVINGGPWLVLDHYLTISKWKPNFKPGEAELRTTLVWLRFPLLPLEMFVESTLLSVGNAVGRAIKVDPFTADMIKGRYARVCVELDLHGPLPPNVLIWGRKQAVEYEGLHHICYQCGQYGHKKDHCPTLHTTTAGAADQASSSPSNPSSSTASQPFGPWMLPAHVRRKQQQAQVRMSRRVQPSAAIIQLNAEIERNLQAAKDPNPPSAGSSLPRFDAGSNPRGASTSSGQQKEPSGKGMPVNFDGRSKYTALTDLEEEMAADDIESLKQKIWDLSGRNRPGNHEKARIKLEKGQQSKVGPNPDARRVGAQPSKAVYKSKGAGPGPCDVTAPSVSCPGPAPPLKENPPVLANMGPRLGSSSSRSQSGPSIGSTVPPVVHRTHMDVDPQLSHPKLDPRTEAVAAIPPHKDTEMEVTPPS